MPQVTPAQARTAERQVNALSLRPTNAQADGSVRLGPIKVSYRASGDKVKVTARVHLGPIKKTIVSTTLKPGKYKITGTERNEALKVKVGFVATGFGTSRRKLRGRVDVCHRTISRLRLKWKCRKVARADIASW